MVLRNGVFVAFLHPFRRWRNTCSILAWVESNVVSGFLLEIEDKVAVGGNLKFHLIPCTLAITFLFLSRLYLAEDEDVIIIILTP